MKTLDIRKVESLAVAVRESRSEPVVLLEDDVPIAVLLPLENADMESIALSLNPELLSIIEESKKRLHHEGGIPSAEMRRRLGIEPKAGGRRS